MKYRVDPLLAPDSEPDVEQYMRASEALESAPAEAIRTLTALAERGSPLSMLTLGCCSRDGIGVAKDLQRAEKWFRSAADTGLARAHYSLGRLYLDAERYVDAEKEFETAASAGFVPAVHFLGRIYYFGLGVSPDKIRGRALLETASRWGCVYAKAVLAHDLLHESKNAWAFVKGVLMKLECFVDTTKILLSEGVTSDRFR